MLRVNSVTLIGRATRDAELKDLGSSKVCSFRIVSNDRVKKKDGTYDEKSMFIDCDAWGQRADYASQYVKKGSVVVVQGKLEQDEWEKDGEKRQKHKIYVDNLQVDRPKTEGGSEGQAEPAGDGEAEQAPAPARQATQQSGKPKAKTLPF